MVKEIESKVSSKVQMGKRAETGEGDIPSWSRQSHKAPKCALIYQRKAVRVLSKRSLDQRSLLTYKRVKGQVLDKWKILARVVKTLNAPKCVLKYQRKAVRVLWQRSLDQRSLFKVLAGLST